VILANAALFKDRRWRASGTPDGDREHSILVLCVLVAAQPENARWKPRTLNPDASGLGIRIAWRVEYVRRRLRTLDPSVVWKLDCWKVENARWRWRTLDRGAAAAGQTLGVQVESLGRVRSGVCRTDRLVYISDRLPTGNQCSDWGPQLGNWDKSVAGRIVKTFDFCNKINF